MTEHKSHKVRIDNIPQEKIICHVSNRSLYGKVFLWSLAVLLLLSKSYILAVIVGFYAFVYTFSTEKKYYDGYDRFFVVHDEPNDECCELIYLSEIEGWEYRVTAEKDKMVLYLRDKERYRLEENVSRRLYSYFCSVLPEKEIRKKKEQ